MKTRKLVAGYAGLAVGGAVIGTLGSQPGVPAGVAATGASAMQLAGIGLMAGAAGNVMSQYEHLNKKHRKMML